MSDLNRRAAEAMGWEYFKDSVGDEWYTMSDGFPCRVFDFDPANRPDHAAMLEEYIYKHGLIREYASAIHRMYFRGYKNDELDVLIAGLNATPEQRTRAFLAAVEGEG